MKYSLFLATCAEGERSRCPVWLSSLPETSKWGISSTSKCPQDSQPEEDPESEEESELPLLCSTSLDWSSFRLALTWNSFRLALTGGAVEVFLWPAGGVSSRGRLEVEVAEIVPVTVQRGDWEGSAGIGGSGNITMGMDTFSAAQGCKLPTRFCNSFRISPVPGAC